MDLRLFCFHVTTHSQILKIELRTHETEKVCSWTYLLKNNQIRQFVKLMISSMLRTHARDEPIRP